MVGTESVETFCADCGTRVEMKLQRRGDEVVGGREPCHTTAGGTVYRDCPSCGETVALHPPYEVHARRRAAG